MKAAVYRTYGSPEVVRIEEVANPAPKENEVLIKVRAASVNPLDWRIMKGKPYFFRLVFGWSKPRSGRPGVDVAGEVEAVGTKVTEFKVGDAVFGMCKGAIAEYVCTEESRVLQKPDNVSFEQAAAVGVAGFTALQGLRDKGKVQAGQKVLVNGAAGGCGTFAVQIAKSMGAEVTGVCSTRNVEMVRSLGADRVIDYTQEDFTKGAERYDVIFDCIVNHSLAACRGVMKNEGICVMVGGPHSTRTVELFARPAQALLAAPFVSQKCVTMLARPNKEDLRTLGGLLESGKLMPMVERSYALSEAAAAIAHVEGGHARGKVVVGMNCSDSRVS